MIRLKNVTYFQNWAQITSIFIVSLTLLNEGVLLCWPSYAILIVTNPDHPLKITPDEASYFSVLPYIGAMLAALPAGLLANKIGRKKTLIICTIPYFISGLLLGFSNSLWIYYIGRFIQGFGSACTFAAAPLYTGEVALPKVRGKWGSLLLINTNVGYLISYIIGSCFNLLEISYFCMGIPLITLFLLLWVPESPYYLFTKNQHNAAKASLEWLRQREDVDEELATIQKAVERQMTSPSTYKDIVANKYNRKAFVAIFIARFAQLFLGSLAIAMYAHPIFARAGGNLSVSMSTIICGIVQLIFIIIGTMANHKFGRRSTLFTSAGVGILSLLTLAIYFYIDDLTTIDLSSWNWFPLVGLLTNLSAYAWGLAFIPTLLAGEIFSSSIKEKAISLTNIWLAALIAGSSKIFQALANYGLEVPFTFFAITSVILLVVCYFVIPETKGKTLDEIQLAFIGEKKTLDPVKTSRSKFALPI